MAVARHPSNLTSHIVRHQYHYVDNTSGVGVIDKTVALLSALSVAPRSLAELVAATGLPRPTAHRLALALEHHGLVDRDGDGRFIHGHVLAHWSSAADPWLGRAQLAVLRLRDQTGESAQVYRRADDDRVCIASAEPPSGLRDTVPVGALLSMKAGSAAQVLAAWLPAPARTAMLRGAAYNAATLAEVRRRGWAQSIGQREPGVASVSAPVLDSGGDVIAAVSISGPIERLANPSAAQRRSLTAAAASLGAIDANASR